MNNQCQKGFTLTELMIGMLMGTILISALISIYVLTISNSRTLLSSTKLSQEITAVSALISTEVRRAGYWEGASNTNNTGSDNPYYATNYSVRINNARNCLAFAYDFDRDTDDTTVDANDLFAYRLDNNSVQVLTAADVANFATNPCADNAGTWLTLTDSNTINISSLQFTAENSQCYNLDDDTTHVSKTNSSLFPCECFPSTSNSLSVDLIASPVVTVTCNTLTAASGERLVETREVGITVVGNLVSDNSVTKTINESIKIRNDRVILTP